MDVKYYMRENTAGATTYDLETDFKGLRIISVDGLEQYGDIKNVFEREYVEENEIDVLYPTNPVYKPTTITMKFIIAETFITDTTTFADAKDAFIQYISSKNVVYWDTYRNKRAFMYRDGALDITDDRRRDGSSYIQITVKYKNTKGFVDNYDINNLMSFDTTWNIVSGDQITMPFYSVSPNEEVYVDWGDGSENTTIAPLTDLINSHIKHTYSITNTETKIRVFSASTTSTSVGSMPKFYFGNVPASKLKIISADKPLQTMYNGITQITSGGAIFYECTNFISAHNDLFKYNTQLTDLNVCFAESSIANTPTLQYNVNLYYIESMYRTTRITSMPTGYFDNLTSLISANSAFLNCAFLPSYPQYLFRYNKVCLAFAGCFYGCTKLKLSKNLFCDNDTEKNTRFLGQTVSFDGMFYRTSYNGNGAGEVDDIWNYSGSSKSSNLCFGGAGNSVSSIENYADIPSTWGGTTTYRLITITQVTGAEISPTSWGGNAIVKNGSNITFNITTQTGYSVIAIIANGTSLPSATTYTFTNVTADKTLTVTTGLNEFEIETFAGIGGTITPNDTVYAFTSKTVTITPNTKYVINRVEVDGVNMGAITSYTFTNILSDHTVNAYFTEIIQFKTTWTIPSDNYNLYLPFTSVALTRKTPNESVYIDWGDGGSIQEYTALTVLTALNMKHLYATSGTYQISIWSESSTCVNAGKMPFWDGTTLISYNFNSLLISIDTPLLPMYDGNNLQSDLSYIFAATNYLTTVCDRLTTYLNSFMTAMVSSFEGCSRLLINKDIFCDDENERYTMFNNKTIDFTDCFLRTAFLGSDAGTAPALWDYSGNITGSDCFAGSGNATLSNIADIPPSFGGSATYYTITINQAIGGYITPTGKNGNIYIRHGYMIKFYFTPLSGKTIQDVIVNGASQGAITSYQIASVTANQIITAVFI